jgi:hypothetical protein
MQYVGREGGEGGGHAMFSRVQPAWVDYADLNNIWLTVLLGFACVAFATVLAQ